MARLNRITLKCSRFKGGAFTLEVSFERAGAQPDIGEVMGVVLQRALPLRQFGACALQVRAGLAQCLGRARRFLPGGLDLAARALQFLFDLLLSGSAVGELQVECGAAGAGFVERARALGAPRLFQRQIVCKLLLGCSRLLQRALGGFELLRLPVQALLRRQARAHFLFKLLGHQCHLGALGGKRRFGLLQFRLR